MAKRLFVGRLPYSINDKRLEEIFSEVGIVSSATVINDRDTGQSKGFGFVEYEKDQDAAEAITKLNDREIEGRKIVVSEARPREERPRFENRGDRRF